jgi:hypothetical protein
MKAITALFAALLCLSGVVSARQAMPPAYQAVLTTLGRSGDFKDGVLKVNLPRTDLKVTINGRAVPTALGFGGWLALTNGDMGEAVMMGDFVMTEDQVNPVLSAILDNGLEATAVHNHFFWESPRIFYMHVHGHGAPADLARRVKPAVDLMLRGVTPAPAAPSAAPATPSIDGAALSKIIGFPGEQIGTVYKITIARADLNVKDMGAVINSRMGLNTWAAFTGTNDDAVVAGDVAMLGKEVTPVLKAMRKAGLSVVSLHHHMIGTQPEIYFLHYWGQGSAATLAAGVTSAVALLGK